MDTIDQNWNEVRHQVYDLANKVICLGFKTEDEFPPLKAWRAKMDDLVESLDLVIPKEILPAGEDCACPNCDSRVDLYDDRIICHTCGQRLNWHDVYRVCPPRVIVTGYSTTGIQIPRGTMSNHFETLEDVLKLMDLEYSYCDVKLYLHYDTSKGRHMKCLVYAERGVTDRQNTREKAMDILADKILNRTDDEFAPFGSPIWAVGDEVIEE